MERAEGAEACSGALEREVGPNHIDDVVGVRDALDAFLRDESHAAENTLRVNWARGRFPHHGSMDFNSSALCGVVRRPR